eukprot:m51a1_g8453 hypothetical protein (223) ;mRNA; f:405307-406187
MSWDQQQQQQQQQGGFGYAGKVGPLPLLGMPGPMAALAQARLSVSSLAATRLAAPGTAATLDPLIAQTVLYEHVLAQCCLCSAQGRPPVPDATSPATSATQQQQQAAAAQVDQQAVAQAVTAALEPLVRAVQALGTELRIEARNAYAREVNARCDEEGDELEPLANSSGMQPGTGVAFPRTRGDLERLSPERCAALAQFYELPAVPGRSLLDALRRFICTIP